MAEHDQDPDNEEGRPPSNVAILLLVATPFLIASAVFLVLRLI